MWITVTMFWAPTSSLWVGIKHLIENKSPTIICSCLREGLKKMAMVNLIVIHVHAYASNFMKIETNIISGGDLHVHRQVYH